MQKIGFCDKYSLTQAVLNGTKTMTRRVEKGLETFEIDYQIQFIYSLKIINQYWDEEKNSLAIITPQGKMKVPTRYKVGETVAVAQSYKSIHNEMINGDFGDSKYDAFRCAMVANTPGWSNKLFVKPDLMPHQIQITSVSIERLQDITDEDCLREGIRLYTLGIPPCETRVVGNLKLIPPYGFDDYHHKHFCNFDNPREAFASLINRPGVGRKGLWQSNPWVICYSFKLVK